MADPNVPRGNPHDESETGPSSHLRGFEGSAPDADGVDERTTAIADRVNDTVYGHTEDGAETGEP